MNGAARAQPRDMTPPSVGDRAWARGIMTAMTYAPDYASVVPVPLRWSDMDAYGHVNNVQFLRLLEDARILAFAQWFGRERSVVGEGIIVARHEIEYRAPLLFRIEPIEVAMWITHLGGAAYDVGYEVRDGGHGSTTYALAETTLVGYDFQTEQPRRLEEHDKTQLRRFVGPPVPFRHRAAEKRREASA